MTANEFTTLIQRAERVLAQLEAWLPPATPEIDWTAHAYRWRKRGARGWLDSVRHVARIDLDDLQHIERQKSVIDRNTQQFIEKKPANNVLMTGARGTGKSSLVKAMLAAYADRGLRLIEVDKSDLGDLADIVELVAGRPERYIVFCDDLSFEEGEAGYKALKSVLDGSVAASGDNVLIYATSNRRHLMPEYMSENLQAKHQPDGEIHPGETVEEKSRCPSASACGCRSIPSSRTTTWTSSTTGCASWVAGTAHRALAHRGPAMDAGARLALGTRRLPIRPRLGCPSCLKKSSMSPPA